MIPYLPKRIYFSDIASKQTLYPQVLSLWIEEVIVIFSYSERQERQKFIEEQWR